MAVTAQMDLFIKVDGNGEFLRLVYCPYKCGFDAPAATPEMIPPREMIGDGRLRWVFNVLPGEADNESHLCAFDQKEVPDGQGGYALSDWLDVYRPVAHSNGHLLSNLHEPACFSVVSWSRASAPPSRSGR